MYYPYFRGKQFELLTIREMAGVLAKKKFTPLIEPVRESLNSLKKTLDIVCEFGGNVVVIINPYHGDHQGGGASITDLIKTDYKYNGNICAGILLRNKMTIAEVMACYHLHADHCPVLIHAGFTSPGELAIELKDHMHDLTNVFLEDYAKLLYRKHFNQGTRILVRDGFKRLRNADYPPMEEFSELHVTYDDLNMAGFGDFLIVGDDYNEGGGPAYAVAIHLTFIDPSKDNVMYIYHFVSTSNTTPADPAGKFAQALKKLIEKLDSGKSHLLETEAIKEFRQLYDKGHFPGLGHVKKLSMKHHIETLAAFLQT